ncbi:hypothetical protein [Paenibacillus spongiae]|uniref:YiaAB two helix domain-containing protein n=1 Tax=Paenibacillus spongiae TaxID=2909671 RepID=A0ABY5S1P2_9BACL|nr:hypothetical protein [Paenibacillus spongiae]UVI27787.1 hypothetical protein L1F29_20240 [Paenibacillus spongiae]
MMKTNPIYAGRSELDRARRLFTAMKFMAWACLAAGIVLSLWNVSHFSDKNLTLMLGIGFMVGSVFIYTIGTAINMVESRKLDVHDMNERPDIA